MSKDSLIIRLQVLKVSFWLRESFKFEVRKTYGGSIWPPPPPFGRSRVNPFEFTVSAAIKNIKD